MAVQVVWYQYTAFNSGEQLLLYVFSRAGYWNQEWRKQSCNKAQKKKKPYAILHYEAQRQLEQIQWQSNRQRIAREITKLFRKSENAE